jgi:hypothetical protein
MKNLALAFLSFAFLAGSSYAADAPNIVGTWKAISGVSSTTGTELKKAPAVLSQQPWHSEINITEQKGRVFNGATKRPDGSQLMLAGAFAANGKNFTISTDKGILTGTYEAGKLEYCGATLSTEYNLTFCSTLEKAK